MKNLCTYLLAATMSLTLLGCSKKETATPAPTKTELLTNKNWVMTAQTVSPGFRVGTTTITDLYAQMPPCTKDDFIRFETPNVFKEDEGPTKCSTNDPQTQTGTWTFNSTQSIITVVSQGQSQDVTVVDLTDTALKVTATEVSGGITYTITITYRKS